MTPTDVWCVTPNSSGGWSPITALAHLTARLWETEPVFIHPAKPYGPIRKVLSMAPRRRGGNRNLLIIAAHPGDLLSLARPGVLAGRYDRIGAWIIDSFWDERIPRFARERHSIDHLWITDGELVDRYAAVTGIETGWLPWGTDALTVVGRVRPKSVDVLRLGRQPRCWEDDDLNAAELAARGLSYQGRFPMSSDGRRSWLDVTDQLQVARFVLASGNLASPTDYSHRRRDYISARFTDALAAGTRIAGRPPTGMAADLIPGVAWVPFTVDTRTPGLDALQRAAADSPGHATDLLRKSALEVFDWRHRVREITTVLDSPTARLHDELGKVRAMAQGLDR